MLGSTYSAKGIVAHLQLHRWVDLNSLPISFGSLHENLTGLHLLFDQLQEGMITFLSKAPIAI